jgi:CRP-like cAMP-binding protein
VIDLTTLGNVPVLEELTPADLRALGELADERICERGQRLLAHGQIATHFYLVDTGRFALTIQFDVGGRLVEAIVDKKGPGDGVGWSAAVAPRPSLYSVYCVWPGRLIQFPRSTLQALMSRDVGLGYRLMRNVVQLVAERATVLQELWRQEVERDPVRVEYWRRQSIDS